MHADVFLLSKDQPVAWQAPEEIGNLGVDFSRSAESHLQPTCIKESGLKMSFASPRPLTDRFCCSAAAQQGETVLELALH